MDAKKISPRMFYPLCSVMIAFYSPRNIEVFTRAYDARLPWIMYCKCWIGGGLLRGPVVLPVRHCALGLSSQSTAGQAQSCLAQTCRTLRINPFPHTLRNLSQTQATGAAARQGRRSI